MFISELKLGSRNATVVRELKEGMNVKARVISAVCCWFSQWFFSMLFSLPPSPKTNTLKFQFNLATVDEEPLL